MYFLAFEETLGALLKKLVACSIMSDRIFSDR